MTTTTTSVSSSDPASPQARYIAARIRAGRRLAARAAAARTAHTALDASLRAAATSPVRW
ncbi:MAG TPA: hypothetical protein VFR56_05270 [Actinomycetes bacterium]|nr:hypothetical protein [Actinomycetes bacterium]